MTVLRPMCAICFREPREPGSARCYGCGPGRLNTQPKPRQTRMERAAQELNATDKETQ